MEWYLLLMALAAEAMNRILPTLLVTNIGIEDITQVDVLRWKGAITTPTTQTTTKVTVIIH